jgi:hypothetical protein
MKTLKSFIREVLLEKKITEVEPHDECDECNQEEVSSIGGGAIRGHIGPLGSDNRSPHLKGQKKKKKHYEPAMRAFGGAMEVS